jgi:hypothetical protein
MFAGTKLLQRFVFQISAEFGLAFIKRGDFFTQEYLQSFIRLLVLFHALNF